MSNKGTRKRKFLPEELKVVLTEFQLQLQALRKRRKLINNGIQAWHGRKKKQCDNQAAKVRIEALKDDDQGAYMRLVKESKDVRLIRIVAETNQLLLKLGSIVQQQRDARNGSQNDTSVKEDIDIGDSNCHDDSVDLLEGQRQYNSTIHSIQEQVKEQPPILEGGELRPYQLEGLQWMLSLFNNNLNGILADDMGLGKTIQIISLIAYLKENKGVSGPHLIVAPKVVLPNWMDEFSKWLPNDKIKAVLYDGNRTDRKAIREQLSREGFDVLISHYDLIKIDKLILRKIHWHYLIVDEGHKIKNNKSAFSQIIRGYNAQRKLLLTGTPLQNNVEELWSLLNFLLPEIFDSVDKFQKWFNAPFRPRSSLSKEMELLIIRRLHQVIRPFILRRKKDEVEKCLPLKSQFILKCNLSAWQKVYYQQILEEERAGLPPGSSESEEVRNLSMQLRKCCNHPGLFLKNSTMWPKDEIMRASGKFELLDRLLPKFQATGHRVLLFSQMTRLINILEIYLQSHDYKYLRLDGSEKTKKRKESLQKFNDPDSPYFMFLLSTRTGCVGLNLQTADTVIIFDSDWNPQIDLQAEDRAHRIGQDKEVRVFVLLTVGSIEEVILERAKQKRGIDAKVIQAGLFNTKSTEADRREMLEEIMRRRTSSLGTDLPSEREINGLLARSEEELRIFEEMDEERRQKENGRPRLMEEHEVPTWAFSELDDGKVDEHEEGRASEEDNANNVLGKRRRKKQTYAGSGWTMAMEEYEWEPSKISSKKRRRECPSQGHESASNNGTQTEKKVVKLKIKLGAPSDRTSEDISRLVPKRCRSSDRIGVKVKQECYGTENSDH